MFDNRSTFTSLETILFIREVIEVHPEHRQVIFEKICDSFEDIRSHLVIRVALWILGEYASSQKDIDKAFETIRRNVGSLPIFQLEQAVDGTKEETKDSSQS
jgi:coatomer subunit beta